VRIRNERQKRYTNGSRTILKKWALRAMGPNVSKRKL
jgi:hypothetical protein